MRPAGLVRQALLSAAADLAREVDGERRGPTLQELAARACVGVKAASDTVKHMRREGKLDIVRQRRVPYRNRPVAEYAPAQPRPPQDNNATVDVASIFALWAQG